MFASESDTPGSTVTRGQPSIEVSVPIPAVAPSESSDSTGPSSVSAACLTSVSAALPPSASAAGSSNSINPRADQEW
jgi:hypothetical protein